MSLARHAKKRDLNEPEIVKALRAIGCTVLLADHPDLIVGYRGRTFLLEVKNPHGASRLTDSQKALRRNWNGGPLAFVYSVDEAVEVVTLRD